MKRQQQKNDKTLTRVKQMEKKKKVSPIRATSKAKMRYVWPGSTPPGTGIWWSRLRLSPLGSILKWRLLISGSWSSDAIHASASVSNKTPMGSRGCPTHAVVLVGARLHEDAPLQDGVLDRSDEAMGGQNQQQIISVIQITKRSMQIKPTSKCWGKKLSLG